MHNFHVQFSSHKMRLKFVSKIQSRVITRLRYSTSHTTGVQTRSYEGTVKSAALPGLILALPAPKRQEND